MSLAHRSEKAASVIREELTRLLIHEVSDPALKDIAVTEVRVTSDLKIAKVYYDTLLGSSQQPAQLRKDLKKGLERATPFLRHRIGLAIRSKFVPELRFYEDTQIEHAAKLLSLIDETHSGA